MLQEPVRSWRKLAVWWIVANAAGWAATMGVFEALPYGFRPIACAIIGTAQWVVLRSRLRVSPWWMAATSLAWFGGLWAGAARADFFFGPDPSWAGGVGGALAGILQYWTLRRRASTPLLWLPVSIVASIAGWWAGEYVGVTAYFNHLSLSWSYIIGGAIGGTAIGALSAPVLIRMVRKTVDPLCNSGDPVSLLQS